MYSIVLMAATAAGPTTPAADATPVVVAAPAVGCCGGVVVGGCTGYYAGCSGCTGCYGYRAPVFHRHHARHSCTGSVGSCTGWSCFGSASCYGCYGSCWGSYSYGCWGSCYGSYSYGASYGCYGASYGCGGGCYGHVAPPAVVIPVEPAPAPKKDGASLRFSLPPNAVLFVDGQRAAGDGAERAFYTPPLQAGQRYFYDVKAEVTVNGRTEIEEKRVIVTAGADVTETFARLIAFVADPTTVAGR